MLLKSVKLHYPHYTEDKKACLHTLFSILPQLVLILDILREFFIFSGEIILARPLEEITAISHVGDPIILTVVAEEVRLSLNEPEAMLTTVQLAFILGERGNQPPYFANEK